MKRAAILNQAAELGQWLASSPLLDSRYYSQRTEVLLRVGHRLQY